MRISVIGLGYVGSVAAAALASEDHDVLGLDIDVEKVRAYQKGEVPIYEPELSKLVRLGLDNGKLNFKHTEEFSQHLGEVILIAVGTPPSDNGVADLSQVRSSLKWISEKQSSDSVIIMKSTVPPGTGIRLRDTVLQNDRYIYISNPEFLREGHAVQDWLHPDRIVIGGGDTVMETVRELYRGIHAPFVNTDITSAEMIKYAANAFLATKISFINEIAALCDRVGATIDDVAAGIALDDRIGPNSLRAGVGYGGSCFPKDVRALDQLALTNDHNFELLRSVITVNNRQRLLPLYALRGNFEKLAGLNIGVLGLAFKPETSDVREAPALDLIRMLVEEGVNVKAYDPRAIPAAKMALPSEVEFSEDLLECVNGTQAVVLMTEWSEIVEADWKAIAEGMLPGPYVFDGRNALEPAKMRWLGFEYRGVGRMGACSSN